ncbi:MAG: hypothetical protein V8Q76_13160 [Bacteroides intestinalis]
MKSESVKQIASAPIKAVKILNGGIDSLEIICEAKITPVWDKGLDLNSNKTIQKAV